MPGLVQMIASGTEIADVPSFSYADGRDSLVLAAWAAAKTLGRDKPYAALKGLSALAFRLMFPADWRRYSPDALAGFDHTRMLFDPMGLSVSPVQVSSQEYQQVTRRMIIESINKGYPVLGLHLMEWEDWGVIVGYAEDGKVWLCRTPHDQVDEETEPAAEAQDDITDEGEGEAVVTPPPPYSKHQHQPEMLIFITGEQPESDEREAILTSLRKAVELYETPQFGAYYSGKAAYLKWVEDLRDVHWYRSQGEPDVLDEAGIPPYTAWVKALRKPESANMREDRPYDNPYLERAHVNAWRLTSLIDARRAASTYLKEASLVFTGQARENLQIAAIRYNWLAGMLESIRTFVPWDDELEALPWTQAMREREADMISSARFLEEQAVVEIRQALAAIA